MQTLISGKIDNHYKWFLNEIAEFEADFNNDKASQATLLEIFDVLSFVVADTLIVDKKHLKEEFENNLLWIKMVVVLKQHNVESITKAFSIWFDKKEAKYPSVDNKYHWRAKVLDLVFEVKASSYNNIKQQYKW